MGREYKECKHCHKMISADYPGEVCPECEEDYLFAQVREYIRDNEVNEFMVAEKFQISLRKIRGWIREGRIEYVDEDTRIVGTQCQRCGKPVGFGMLCPSCMRLLHYSNKKIQLAEDVSNKKQGKMRFLDEE